jgi:hypothetical protein
LGAAGEASKPTQIVGLALEAAARRASRFWLLVDQIAEAVLAVDPSTVKINYSINKKPADPYNFLMGSRFEFNKSWEARVEAGFIGREQLLASVAYRWAS